MAQITVVYKDFNEMVAVAKELLKCVEGKPETDSEKSESGKQKEMTAYGRQIAQDFPNANVSVAAAQSAPVQVPVSTPASVPTQTTPVQTPSAQTVVQTSQHEYTMDELARAAMTLMDKGGMAELQKLLAGYGCETLQQLPKEQYGSFATALRGMGAQI